MPLLHHKPFTRTPPPADMEPAERLFYCRVTNEVFRDYDMFFERTILCNSLVWSCSFTGKSGLTYQEALESEKKVKKSLLNFPESVIVPVLYLATLSSHQKVSDLCEDMYDYVKDRFFIGETVTVTRNSGARLECTILEVKLPPPESGMTNGHSIHSDTIIISDSDDEPDKDVPDIWKKKDSIDPLLFKYKVEPIVKEMYESVTVKQCQVSRKPSMFSQDKLKNFLKLHCEIQNGIVKPKASSITKYQILEKNFFHYFPDEPPRFILSAEKKAAAARKHLRRDNANKQAARERERILQHKAELKTIEIEKERLRKERAGRIQSRNREEKDKLQKGEYKKTVQVERLKRREERKIMKLEREKEREKIREEKRKYAERLKLWNQRRDDLECDDLKNLPDPVTVKTRLPPDCFGDAIMVLEFLHAFGELFDLKDEFPEGITFELLEEALVGSDPEGPLCELLFFFLSAIFQALAEEEEDVANDQITDTEAKGLTDALGEDADTTKSALYAVASLAAAWPQLNHGCSLKELDLDSCTLSEILRLHILASGAESNSANAKYRYQKQGGFIATDDACLELRMNHPAILKKLSTTSVYDLLPDEKLKILHALCGKLLTLVSTRDYIEDCLEELRQVKQEFRELKAEQNRKEREEAAARIRKRKEEKLKEQGLKMKDKEISKEREDGNRSSTKSAGIEEQKDLDTRCENKDTKNGDQDVTTEDKESLASVGKKRKGLKEKTLDFLGKPELSAVNEELRQKQEEKEHELLEKMQHVTACTNIIPLGRDRWYRRFWTFFSIPGLFVEEDYIGITQDMLQPQPITETETENISKVNGHDSPVKDMEKIIELSKPVDKPNRWSYYSTVEQLDELIECLNTRGYRESSLKEILIQEKMRICQKLCNFPANRFHISDSPPPTDIKPGRGRPLKVYDTAQTSADKHLELRLCELLLDVEDRIYQGTLGSVKVPDRQSWRAALEKCSYILLDNEMKENGTVKLENKEFDMENEINQSNKDRLQSLKTDIQSATSTNASTPQPVTNFVRYLAEALLKIEQGVERKYLKTPLGDAEDNKKNSKFDKKKDDKKRKDEDQTSDVDDAIDSGRVLKTVLDRWRESLLSSGSLSQIFLHLSTLDRSILWSRSIRNARCKVCRKKGDNESMILCDGCERGHHIYCVRPKLKFIPQGDWFCPECRPRQRTHRPNRKRHSVDSDEEELLEDVQEQSTNEDEETDVSKESAIKKEKDRLQFPSKTKGEKIARKPGPKKGSGKMPKSQQVTPKKSLQSPKGRGRGKKPNSAPAMEKKLFSHISIHNSQSKAELHDASLVELVSIPGQSKGQGRGRGRGKSQSVDSTPIGSPFAFRPFTLDNVEQTPKGRIAKSQNSTPSHVEARGRGKRLITAEISLADKGNRRSSGRQHGVHELSACEQLVVELVRHDDSWPFMKLVSKIQVPDYFEIIKRPIALNIIREKVNKCEYKSAYEFLADVELMFSNCFEYNPVNSNEAKAGVRLQAFFMNEAQKLGLEITPNMQSSTPPPAKKSRI
ncbi:bromodomain adjacent to zinc finger domain protein 1A [Hyla sarda]|uniref:bromodomain adjacent to zinc finger domain protein 1A n=1 Tax=Hyla sarda TaxID=327740 RepID=UPI0024C2C399|nr:bromodomain adjacent to zinc finger domain protein 1A [Hyla sarda]XP_056401375.1 bromodomain adjacent to zinc finger domain protein 1A [Hyla sarda]